MKKKIFILSVVCTILVLNSCEKQTVIEVTPNSIANDELKTPQQIDEFMAMQSQKNDGVFNWNIASDEMIWSALKHSENILTVGYKTATITNAEDKLSTINIKNIEWTEARNKILNIVLEEERKYNKKIKTVEDIILYPENTLPNFDLYVSNLATIKKLRQSGLIRYMEPVAYLPESASKSNASRVTSLGCGSQNTNTVGLVAGKDYFTSTAYPNGKISWNFPIHGIPTAWDRGATGVGLKMAYFDTGCSFEQPYMNSFFASYESTGRSIEKTLTLSGSGETANDPCGHGTATSSVGTAPRTTYGTPGIAYRASVITVRAAADVVFTSAREFNGVASAYELIANRPDVRVISMSMGTSPIPFTIVGSLVGAVYYTIYRNKIADAIKLAYQKDKLMFCAAGTLNADLLQNTVIFPANMSEVIAVTGVKMIANSTGGSVPLSNYTNPTICSECFYGSKVDFAVVMQKDGIATRPLSLTRTTNSEPTTFGGSSVATASMSAMATALWSKYPGLTRTQLVERLRINATHGYNRRSDIGWGLVDMDKATR